MSKNNQSNEKKIIIEITPQKSGATINLETKGGAIPPTKVNVVMPPVTPPKKK